MDMPQGALGGLAKNAITKQPERASGNYDDTPKPIEATKDAVGQ